MVPDFRFGPLRSELVVQAQDLRLRELLVLLTPALPVLALGLYPQPVLDVTRAGAEGWLARLGMHGA